MTAKINSAEEAVHILIVDDSPTQAEQLKHILEQHSYCVTAANSGRQALAHMSNHPPTLVITDIVMPEMNGYELCRKIKEEEKTRDIPVILLTSLSSTEDVLEGLACGADNFISKPYSEQYLLSNIANILINARLRKNEYVRLGMEIQFAGKKRFITADQQQMLSMLISTYEAAVTRNKELIQSQNELRTINERLEEIVDERTAKLTAEIAERKKAEKLLKQSETKYRLLADNVHDVIFSFDMNLNYTYISPSVKILRGYEPEEVLKLSLADTLTPSSMDLAVKTLSDAMEMEKTKPAGITESRTIPLEMKRKDGTTVWTEVKLSFIRDQNQQAVGILGVSRDITERKRAEAELQQTLDSLRKSFSATVQVMVSAIEMRDPYTAGHQMRVADLACAIAREMELSPDKIEGLKMAGSIHDIGKISIPAEILAKPTKLTEIEFSLIKEHPRNGYEILKNVESPWPLAQIVYQHHERMNGSGYPNGLTGENLLLESRILAVADVVEAMASHRPYRASPGVEPALEEIEKNKGILYDQDVADACLRLFRNREKRLAKDWGQVLKYQFSRNQ